MTCHLYWSPAYLRSLSVRGSSLDYGIDRASYPGLSAGWVDGWMDGHQIRFWMAEIDISFMGRKIFWKMVSLRSRFEFWASNWFFWGFRWMFLQVLLCDWSGERSLYVHCTISDYWKFYEILQKYQYRVSLPTMLSITSPVLEFLRTCHLYCLCEWRASLFSVYVVCVRSTHTQLLICWFSVKWSFLRC